MTSREIVGCTLEYEGPERVARSFGVSALSEPMYTAQTYAMPWSLDDSDFCEATCTARSHATSWREVGGGRWERTDEWGNTLARVDATSKGEVAKGVLDDLSALASYELPDYSRGQDYSCVVDCRRKNPDKWLIGHMPGFAFNIARKMRRLDQYLADLMLARDSLHELHDTIDGMLEDMIRNYASVGADSVMFPEDWGTQDRTMVSPELWQEEFYPRCKKLCGLAHELGIKVFMHSCGKIESIVPGLMRAGVDVLQFDQPDLHGIDTLASHQENGRITFWCPVDVQKTLQLRDETVIRAKVRQMLDKLWKGRGGFIAGYYTDNSSIGLDPKWQGYACDEFLHCGVRERYA
jgi:uroporphyrinogen decarboxylase